MNFKLTTIFLCSIGIMYAYNEIEIMVIHSKRVTAENIIFTASYKEGKASFMSTEMEVLKSSPLTCIDYNRSCIPLFITSRQSRKFLEEMEEIRKKDERKQLFQAGSETEKENLPIAFFIKKKIQCFNRI